MLADIEAHMRCIAAVCPQLQQHQALILLSSCLQRRRTAEDELNMRTVYSEGDLISVSVQPACTALSEEACVRAISLAVAWST